MTAPSEDDQPISVQAARWALALQTGGETERTEFAVWIRQSPVHVREFLFQSALDQELSEARLQDIDVSALLNTVSGNVVSLPAGHALPPANAAGAKATHSAPVLEPRAGQRVRRVAVRVAAGVLLMAIGLVAWLGFGRTDPSIYETAIGEQRTFELADGSVVQLNPQSRIQVRYAAQGREVNLLAGDAAFTVEHNAARPFRVHVGYTVIEDIGTRFHVVRRASGVLVSVIEGAVEIRSDSAPFRPERLTASPASSRQMSPAPAAPNADSIGSPSPSQGIRIEAGEAARIGATDGTLRRSTIDPAQLAAWRPRHLTFSGDPLSDIVEDFNRYNRVPRIHIRGDMLRAKRFSGGFDADDPESLIEYLRQVDGLLVEVSGDDVTISERGRRTPGDPFRSHTPPLD